MKIKINEIKKNFTSQKCIQLAYLFGSHARGTTRKDSDVDIAVLTKTNLPALKRLSLRLELSSLLSKIYNRDVDAVLLNSAGSILKFQVSKEGKLIFERHKGDSKKFRLNSIKEYFDYLPTFNFHYNRMKMKGAKYGQHNTR